MKIDSFGTNKINNIPLPLDNIKKKTCIPINNKVSNDKINISKKGKEIVKTFQIIKSLPETRENKIDSLKTEIKNNNYIIDAQKIADKMIKNSLEESII